MSKRLLITGAGGFLGSRLSEYFRNREGYECVAVGHRELDIEDSLIVSAFMQGVRPDVVFHCAGISDTAVCEREPEMSHKINVKGTFNMAKACRDTGSKMIFMSSDQIYGATHGAEPHREGSERRPDTVYGRDKLRAEEAVLTYLKDGVALRLSWMYDYPSKGRIGGRDFLHQLVGALAGRQPLILPVHDYRGITYVWEVVRRMEAVLELPGGVYNMGSGNELSTYDTGQMFLEVIDGSAEAAKLVKRDEQRFAAWPRNLNMNTEKLESYGVMLPDTRKGIKLCCSDYGIIAAGNEGNAGRDSEQ
ncbi:MAG: sugar nucleotide-binding protein [Clostridiaceae bacterium]|uniref:dTDP-4-dehydrorhamnose reductase n=1 Tax=Clostridium porci TaxID=2605778 RepID=A0A7X2NIK5_9CLOT|nr:MULTISPECIES: sugar nucleotide-binding protein [Clostridium]MCI6140295.1 sugar nucleotide-binding protein [Clostridium sp.]MDU3397389.1 sugar nucleotide-binding protein [Clostridiales bacterium]MDY3231386.1 sugar nucleotide-binding protein [Clostridiaceae bacterium]MSS35038.1 sugar nucleotide-binding protein [Clostridium porci]